MRGIYLFIEYEERIAGDREEKITRLTYSCVLLAYVYHPVFFLQSLKSEIKIARGIGNRSILRLRDKQASSCPVYVVDEAVGKPFNDDDLIQFRLELDRKSDIP